MPSFVDIPSSQVWWRAVRVVLAIAIVGIVAVALWDNPEDAATELPVTVTLYGPSFLQDVLELGVLPAFARSWHERTGERIEFVTSFAGSGLIVDRVLRRFPAEIVVLSSELDADRLVERAVLPGAVWRALPNGGVSFRSPLALLVRRGDEHGIASWSDLERTEIDVVIPDPITSGCGEHAVLAIWGDAIRSGASPAEAASRLDRVGERIVAMPPSARSARVLFDAGVGDVAVLYETEARSSLTGVVIVPERTLVAEPVVCVIPSRVHADNRARLEALAEFLCRHVEPEFLTAGRLPKLGRGFDEPRAWFVVTDLGEPRELRDRIVVGAWRDRGLRAPP
jgi:ABC-type sulfate transport system substrate-binding protein